MRWENLSAFFTLTSLRVLPGAHAGPAQVPLQPHDGETPRAGEESLTPELAPVAGEDHVTVVGEGQVGVLQQPVRSRMACLFRPRHERKVRWGGRLGEGQVNVVQ